MYYADPDAAGGFARAAGWHANAFRADYVVGADCEESGACLDCLPLSQLYFCDRCSRVVSRRDLAEDVDSYYCPHCLENMPSSEAMLYGMRCSKCWECPVCGSTLTMLSATISARDQLYYLACSYCRWSSRGKLEAGQPEQLISRITTLERESEPKQRMDTLISAFRSRAQEQNREKELITRMRRRSSLSRGSWVGLVGGKRLGGAMRKPGGGAMGGSDRPTGKWNVEDIEAKLLEQAARQLELRPPVPAPSADGEANRSEGGEGGEAAPAADVAATASSAAAAAAAAAVAAPISARGAAPLSARGAAPLSARGRASEEGGSIVPRLSLVGASGGPGVKAEGTTVPILEGLTVDELLRLHTQPGGSRSTSSIAPTQRSILAELQDTVGGAGEQQEPNQQASVASLTQRLQQVCCGYHQLRGSDSAARGAPPVPDSAGSSADRHIGHMQLEGPVQSAEMWSLLPGRKPLLTKRSRRCRLATIEDPVAYARRFHPSLGPRGRTWRNVHGATKECDNKVVKPQINPCSNPPFQKNNVAVSFIPRCTPWAWQRSDGAVTSAGAKLAPGEKAEVVFALTNPRDADMVIEIDPTAFNPARALLKREDEEDYDWPETLSRLTLEQNVEVLTPKFQTTIAKFNDMIDTHEAFGDEAQAKLLKEQDDLDIVPERKQHKILVRLRFQGYGGQQALAPSNPGQDKPDAGWAFFMLMNLTFKERSGETSLEHSVSVIVRLGVGKPTVDLSAASNLGHRASYRE